MSHEGPLFTPDQSVSLLKNGNKRRVESIRKNMSDPSTGEKYSEHRKKLTEGQHPYAILVCCSDSRFPPELIFMNREGDIFVVRTAGHVIGDDAAGSIEYAVEHLGVPLIVVMGHDKCGAVTAAVSKAEAPGHIFNVVERIYPSLKNLTGSGPDAVSAGIDAHILATVEYIKNMEPICKKLVDEGKLKVVGARCSIDTYEVKWL